MCELRVEWKDATQFGEPVTLWRAVCVEHGPCGCWHGTQDAAHVSGLRHVFRGARFRRDRDGTLTVERP